MATTIIYDWVLDELRLDNTGGGGGSTPAIRITSANFAGNNYTNASLVGKTAQVDFDVYSANGSGVLLNVNDGYTFNSGTGTITATPDKYAIIVY